MTSLRSQELETQDLKRSIAYGVSSWAVIALTIVSAMNLSVWFYPLAVLIIANRQLALSLLAHEGVHGNLSSRPLLNDSWARYFCAFPVLVSLSRYRHLHLMHHRFLGTGSDPDTGHFSIYPQSGWRLVWAFAGPWLTGRTALWYMNYFNGFFGLRRQLLPKELRRLDDRWEFLIFWTALLGFFIATGTFYDFAIYWLVPLYAYVFYFRFTGGLQHGIIFSHADPNVRSRTIHGPALIMEFLLPCNINYHREHHDSPRVPFFNLRKLHLQKRNSAPTYLEAVRSLTGQT